MKKFLAIQMLILILTSELFANQSNQLTCYSQYKDDYRIFMSADFLYWRVSQTGMSYGYLINDSANIPLPPIDRTSGYTSNELNIKYRSNPGVRVALGCQPSQNFWRADLIWTYLSTKSSGASDNPIVLESTVVNTYYNVPKPLNNDGINAGADWSVNYNTLDLDISTKHFLSSFVNLQAHLGLRALWLDQKFNIYSYNTWEDLGPPDGVVFMNSESNMVQDIWGLGPMLGVGSQWRVYRGLSLFGQGSFALLWADVNSTNTGIILAATPTIVVDMGANFHTTLPQINLILGGQYDFDICKKYHCTTRLGWEFQTLLNVNFLGGVYESTGDFNLSGLTAGASINF